MRVSFAAVACAAFVLVSCTKPEPVPQPDPIPDRAASTVTADPASGVLADGQAQSTVTVTVIDVDGNPMADVQVTLRATGEGVSLVQPTAPTDASGVARGFVTSNKPVAANVSATATFKDEAYELSRQARVEFVPGPAAKLVFAVPPSNAKAGATIAPPVQVAVQDSLGNTIFDSTAQISLALEANAAGGTLSGHTTAAASSGVATFADLSIEKAGAGYTLVASATGLASVTSGPIEITVAEPSGLAFLVGPSTTGAGALIAPEVQVAVQDPLGNLIPTATDVISLALGSNPAQGTLSGTLSVRAVGGIATFGDLRVDKAGTGYTLAATARNLGGASSEAFDVTAAAGTRLVFVGQPSATVAGAPIAPAVRVSVQDDFGNVIASTPTITLALASNTAGAVLAGTMTVTAVDGIATFDDLTITRAARGLSLVATASGLVEGASSAFDVTPAAATRLAFEIQPQSTVAGTVIAPAVEIGVHDDFGNRVTTARPQVTVAVGVNPGNAVLGGTVTTTATSGLVRFFDLRLEKAGVGYTLVASAAGLAGATSTTFDVGNAAPSQLVFFQAPGNTPAGAAFSPAVEVEVRDRFGNRALTSTDIVTLDLGANPSNGALLGTTAVTAVAGIAHYADLNIDKIGDGYTLVASSGRLSAVTSAPFSIVPAAPAKLAWQTQPPASVAAATALAPAPRVRILDAYDNFVADATNSVSVELRGGATGAALSGVTTLTASNGVATFGDLKVDKASVGYSLLATSPGLSGAQSSAFAVGIAPPASISFKVQPSLSTVNTPFSPAIAVEVRDAGGNLVLAPTAVTVALGANLPAATLNGTKTVNSASGVAVFSDLTVSKAGVGYTLVASTAGAPNATSTSFDVRVGGPTGLAFSVQPTDSVAGVAIAPALQVSVLDQWGNVVPGATNGVTIAADPTSPGPASGDLTAFPVDGIATFSNVVLTKVGTYKLVASSPGLTSGTSVNFVVSVAAPSAAVSTVAVAPAAGVVANGTATSTITVTVLDAFGNPVSGAAVALSATGTANTISTPAATNASGVTTATIKSTKAEMKTITATVGGSLALDAHPTVTFVAGAPSASLSTIAVSPASLVADGVAVSTITVSVLDANGNPVPGAAVAVSSTGSANVLSAAPATGLDGISVSTIASTKAEAKTLSATVTVGTTGTPLTSPKPTVTFVPGAPAKLAWQQQPTNVVSASLITPAPRVVVLDAFDNFVADATNAVALELRGGATGAALTGTTSVAAVNGVASFSTLKVDKAATGYSLFASANGLVGAQSSAFDVSIGAPASLAFKVQPRTSTVNTALSPAIEVSVFDAGGNLVLAATPVTVALGTNPTSATLSGTKTISSSAGVAVFADLTISKPGVGYTLAASATGTPGATSAAFTVNVDVPARLAFSVEPTNTVAGNPITPAVKVSVLDTWGNVVPSATGEIALASDPTSPGPASGTLTATPVDGVATFSNVILEKMGTYKLVASSSGLTSGTSVNFVVSVAPANATASTITVAPATGVVADGTAASTITVTVRDVFGNPISNVAVALTASPATGNTLSVPTNTNASGVTTATLKSTKAEVKTISATVAGSVTLDARPTITFVAGAPSAGLSTVTVSPATGVTADGGTFSNVTVTVLDAKSNPVPGAAVAVTSTGTGNTIAAAPATGLNGVTTTTIASTKAEVKTLTTVVTVAATNTTLTAKPTVTFVPGLPDASRSSVAVSAASLVAGATTGSTVTVTVRDATDNPVPGVAVVLDATPTDGNTLTQPSAVTTAAGVATGTFKSTKAELKTISATAGGVQLNQRPTITILPAAVSPTVSTAVPFPTTLVADGVAISTLTVTALDAYSNPVPAQAVVLTSTGSANTISSPADTNAAGVTSATFASTKAEAKDLTVKIGAATLTNKPRVTFVPDAPSATVSTVTVSPATGVIANNTATSTITVTVKDPQGNPIQGATVALSSDGSGDTISAPAATNSLGVTTATIKSTKAELKTIAAIVTVAGADTTLANAPTINFVPGPVDAARSAVAVAPPIVSADGSSLATVTVTAFDAYLNPVPAQAITLTVTGTLNTVSTPAATGANGISTATIASTKAEVKTVSAKAGTVTITQTASVEFKNLTVNETRSTLVVNPTTGVIADGAATSLITAVLRDVNGNLVTDGVLVTFSSDGTSDVITEPSVTSDANGVATATIKSTKAEIKTISAVAQGLTLAQHPTITFVAGPANASRSSVTASPTSVIADNTALTTVTVVVRDAFDNPVPNQKPTLSATGSNNTFLQPGTTGADGTVSGTLKSSKAESKTITATLATPALVLDQKPVVTFIPGQVSATLSTFTVDPATGVIADGLAKSTVTVTLKDAAGNLIPNMLVSFAATGSGNSFPTNATTDASGVAVAYLTSTVAETKTVSITANGVTLSTTKTVAFVSGVPSLANSSLTTDTLSVIANNVSVANLTATVRDAFDNPVPGASVRFRATGSFNKFTPVSGVTNSSGKLTTTLASSMAEEKKVLAEVGGFAVSTNVTFEYTAPLMVSVSVPAGGGCVPVAYSVRQAQSKRVDMLVEFDSTGTGTFKRATQAGSESADGIYGVATSGTGVAHSFVWNTSVDLPRAKVTTGKLRMTPYVDGTAGTPMTVDVTSLSNSLSFASTVGYSTGTHPRAIAQGDFNRDGRLDLVIASPDRDEIRVFMGGSNGTFGTSTAYASAQAPSGTGDTQLYLWPSTLTVLDANRDGYLDVASGNATGGVTLFINSGTGTFPLDSVDKQAERPTVAIGITTPTAIRAADLNRDGYEDLFVSGDNTLAILLGDAAGNMVPQTSLFAGTSLTSVVAADLNRDGILDLAASDNASAAAYIWRGLGDGTFSAPFSVMAGSGPSSIAAGDFNADGRIDLAVANKASNDVSILIGTGGGAFAAPTNVFSGVGPSSVVVSDLDGDGVLDLAVANETENVLATHLGKGDGTFANGARPIASGMPERLVVGDYNGDGKPDLAVTAWDGGVIDVVLNTRVRRCDPGLATASNVSLGSSPAALSGGDFNTDGKPDVAIIDATDGDLKVLLGTGSGGYRKAHSTAIPGGGGAHFVTADFNADGKLDAVTPAEFGANFFAGSGSGDFSAAVATSGGTFPNALAAGDFNGDDKLDLVALVESSGTASIFLFGGSGFNAPTHLDVGGEPQSAVAGDFNRDGKVDFALVDLTQVQVLQGNGDGTFAAPLTFPAGAAPRFITTGDFDLDGELDLAVANRDGASVSLLLGNGDCSFAAPVNYAVGATPLWLEAAHVDGDEHLDLAIGFGAGRAVELLYGSAGGVLTRRTVLDVSRVAAGATVADFDADGHADVAAMVLSATPRITTLRADGQGGFLSLATRPAGDGPSYLGSADFDRNGTPDLAVSALLGGQVNVLPGDGDGGLGGAVSTALTSPRFVLPADFDRDGVVDLAVASGTSIYPLRGNGAGGFTALSPIAFPGSSPEPTALSAGDFDRDGRLDLVAANGVGNTACLFLGNGVGGFALSICTVVGDGPVSTVVGDFNNDGALDLATANSTHDSVGVLLGDKVGPNPFQPLRSFAVAGTPKALIATDFNGDGKLDLATANGAVDRLSVLIGLGTGYFNAAVNYATPGEPTSLFVADVDDDGKSDLLSPIRGSGVAVFSGSGGGTLLDPTGWYLDAQAYSVADFDRDGRLDFAFANTDADSVGVCVGK